MQSSIVSNDESGNFGLVPKLFQGQFISLNWNSVCSIIQSKKTGETMHQILKSVCVSMHSFGLSTLERSPAGGPEPIGVSKKTKEDL